VNSGDELRPVTLLTSRSRRPYFEDAVANNPDCFTNVLDQARKMATPGSAQSAISILSFESRGALSSALRAVRGGELLVIDVLPPAKRALKEFLRQIEAKDMTQLFFWVPSNFDHAVENLKKRFHNKEFGPVLHLSISRDVPSVARGYFAFDPGRDLFGTLILAMQFADDLEVESLRVQKSLLSENGTQAEIVAQVLNLKGPQGVRIDICQRVSSRSAAVETINLLGLQGQTVIMRDLVGFGAPRCGRLWLDDPKNFYPTGIQEVVKLSAGKHSNLVSFQGIQGALNLLQELQEKPKPGQLRITNKAFD
jgi:hypothetical protein